MVMVPKNALASSLSRLLKKAWPPVPFGLLLLFIGAVNVLTGLQLHGLSTQYHLFGHVVPLSELSSEVSLGILGSGVQLLLGGGMLVTGAGLFWRLRSAWAFSMLLLIIAVAVDLFSHRPIHNVLPPGLVLAALIIWKSQFDRRSLVGNYLMSFIGLLAVIAYGIVGSLLLGRGFQPNIHNLYTAFYFTVVTLSTVGSNINPVTHEAEMFMATLILGGISIFTTTIVATLGPLLSRRMNPLLEVGTVKVGPDSHVVLIGDSLFTRSITREFASRNISFVQVLAPESATFLSEQLIVRGDPSDEAVLKHAGVLSAKTVVVACEDDEVSASVSLIVKKLNSNVRVIVVADSSRSISRLNLSHADMVLSPMAVGARLLTNLLSGTSIPRELQDLFEGS